MTSVFAKIKKFFASLFNNKKMLNASNDSPAIKQEVSNYDTSKDSAFVKLKDDARMLELENRFMKGEITEDDISKEDAESLKSILLDRKNELQKKLDGYAKTVYDILSKDDKFLDLYNKYEDGNINEDTIEKTTIVKIRLYKRALKLL